jgi:hypothetical protein
MQHSATDKTLAIVALPPFVADMQVLQNIFSDSKDNQSNSDSHSGLNTRTNFEADDLFTVGLSVTVLDALVLGLALSSAASLCLRFSPLVTESSFMMSFSSPAFERVTVSKKKISLATFCAVSRNELNRKFSSVERELKTRDATPHGCLQICEAGQQSIACDRCKSFIRVH